MESRIHTITTGRHPGATRRNVMRLTGGLVAAGLVVAGCGDADGETSDDGPISITYASFEGPPGMPAKFGEEKGFFADEGVDVEFVSAEDPVGVTTSGDADLADGDTTSALTAAGQGAPVKIVSSMFRTEGPFYLLGNNDIDSVEDLAGKRVGIARQGSGMEVYTRVILAEHGLSEDDVTLVPNGSHQEAYASVDSDQVDATIIHEPFVSLAEAEGKGQLLAQGWEYLPSFHTGVQIANEQFVDDNPEAVKRFLTAYFRAATYAKENQDEFLEFAADRSDVDEEVQATALEREEPIWDNIAEVDLDRLVETQEIQMEYGFQDTIYEPEDIVDDSHVPSEEEIAEADGAE